MVAHALVAVARWCEAIDAESSVCDVHGGRMRAEIETRVLWGGKATGPGQLSHTTSRDITLGFYYFEMTCAERIR